MNPKATIIRQLIAGCLLAVFLVITGVKFFHSHETVADTKYSSGTEQVKESSDCAVCDYHFTKDSELSAITHTRKSPHFVSISPICPECSIPSSIGLHYSDRGPPAFA